MEEYGFDILDLHYHLRHQLQRRADDGVHWDMTAHRRISNLILSHIADAWNVKPLAGGYIKEIFIMFLVHISSEITRRSSWEYP